MRRRIRALDARSEEGWALVIAITLMTIMLAVALSAFAYVDAQQTQSAVGRHRDTAFNVGEAAMNAQIFALQNDWPGVSQSAPADRFDPCDQGSSPTNAHCPNPATLAALFTSPDTTPTTVWTTSVRDNVGSAKTFYSDALTASAPGYDSNGDGKLWVRAQATAKGRTRALVALVAAQKQVEDIPRAVLISGRLTLANNGRKVLIDAQGGSPVNGLVAVRCIPSLSDVTPCLGHNLGGGGLTDLNRLLDAQIRPNITQTGYASGDAMDSDARARLMATAIADGTYHTSCPPFEKLTGQVVYIDTASTCSYTANGQVNADGRPGMILMARGTISFSGTADIWGLIYHSNESDSTATAVRLSGNAVVHGGVIVDGDATTVVGQSKLNITLDTRAFNAPQSYGQAGIVQNTWREIKAP